MVRKLSFKRLTPEQQMVYNSLRNDNDGIRWTPPKITKRGAKIFTPTPSSAILHPEHPFYREQHDEVQLERYEQPRKPIDLGYSELSLEALGFITVNVRRMPIKYPGTDYRLPVEIQPFWALIERIAAYEATHNPRHAECLAHLTVDRMFTRAGMTHRYPGLHMDGVHDSRADEGQQGAPYYRKTGIPVEHSYIVASSPPTEFCHQTFSLQHMRDGQRSLSEAIDAQADEMNITLALPWHVYLLDPYMVHRTPLLTEDADRTFIRVAFAYSMVMDPNFTNNPLFQHQKKS